VSGFPDTPTADETLGTAMIYSSGTTGRPKGIFAAVAGKPPRAAVACLRLHDRVWRFRDGTIHLLSPAPLYHTAPLAAVALAVRIGGAAIIMEHFDPEQFLALVERQHLAHIKCPRSVDFTEELPRLPTGKLYKRLLRDRYWGAREAELYEARYGRLFSSGPLAKDRAFLANTLLVGFELPAGEFVTPALLLLAPSGVADRLATDVHRRRFGRAFQQVLTLRRWVRSEVGIARFVADRDDHTAAAGGLQLGLGLTAFETAIKAEALPRFGEFIPATAMGHSTTLTLHRPIGRISVGGPHRQEGTLTVSWPPVEGVLSLFIFGSGLAKGCATVSAKGPTRRLGQRRRQFGDNGA
jgi:hypothetical protein